ncbi:hypothetical protein AVEN_61958-1 [Araneus ventricosus]|uniref:Uncharacterized protein n=1 Tax=Araneus ventricosus TaxID=182803 RepID=A0A4Y2SQ60_ARAVE|nr:hypothetical protein AVEN_61958-1 [Araneus ventricosus]
MLIDSQKVPLPDIPQLFLPKTWIPKMLDTWLIDLHKSAIIWIYLSYSSKLGLKDVGYIHMISTKVPLSGYIWVTTPPSLDSKDIGYMAN